MRDRRRSLLLALALGGPLACASPGGPAWEQIPTEGVPPRWGHVAELDAERDRMLVFGGEGPDGKLDDVWALELASGAWSEVATSDGPGPRSDMASVLDAANRRWIIIGGRIGLATSIAEVWALDLTSGHWSELEGGPSPRHDVSAATDGKRAWVFGGAGDLFQSLDDLWELDLSTDQWRELPAGKERPIARTSYALVHWEGALYLHGGHDVDKVFRDTWRYDLTAHTWQQLDVSGRAAANAHFGHALDAECGALMLTGGDNLDNFVVSVSEALALGDKPRFSRVPASNLPPPRDHATLVVDADRHDMVLYGGGSLGDGLDTFGDAWRYPLGGCL